MFSVRAQTQIGCGQQTAEMNRYLERSGIQGHFAKVDGVLRGR